MFLRIIPIQTNLINVDFRNKTNLINVDFRNKKKVYGRFKNDPSGQIIVIDFIAKKKLHLPEPPLYIA